MTIKATLLLNNSMVKHLVKKNLSPVLAKISTVYAKI